MTSITRPETDLGQMLANLDVERREGEFVFVSRTAHDEKLDETLVLRAQALVRETEGVTYVFDTRDLQGGDEHRGTAAQGFRAAWLTLRAHSTLEAVGLTAAVAAALAAESIACNVIAGAHHDHLLVPANRAEDAIAALARLRAAHRS